MQWYNIEIFTPDLSYRSSNQTTETEVDIDYLAISNSKVVLPAIRASEGDYIRISGHGSRHIGIVTGCTDSDKGYEIQFKPMLALLDVDVHMTQDGLKTSLEQWLADIMNATYRDSDDEKQNITGFGAAAGSQTQDAILDFDGNIVNLYQMASMAFLRYGVVVSFDIDLKKKRLRVTVEKVTAERKVIEADMLNILSASFVIKQADQTVNKMVIYNDADESQTATFYLLGDGTISEDVNAEGRLSPVVFSTEYVTYEEPEKPKEDAKTFHDIAYERAYSRMSLPVYNNLIEIEVMNDDGLVQPQKLQIGQQATIIRNNTAYQTMLTGKKVGDTTILVFGAVRLELTKKLKRRITS